MSGIVIAGTTLWSRFWTVVSGLVPSSWSQRLAGPATTIVIGPDATDVLDRRSWFRPIHLLLQPELLLQKRLTLPASAQADLASSVVLMVLSATPFTPAELLIHVAELDRREAAADIAYDVHLTPRDRIAEALASLNFPAWRVTKIAPLEPSAPVTPDFAPALGPAGLLGRCAAVLSIGVLAVALLTLGHSHLARLRYGNAALDAAIVERETAMRANLSELTKRQEAISAQALLDQTLAGTPSVFLVLEQLRANLPATVSVTRMSVDGTVLRLEVRAPEMLQLLRTLAAAMPDWSASVEGSIARGPDGVTELATLLLQWTAR